ncbi:MAG: replication factor C small subunit [Candidatus Aenigmarchaeota archaeon]|nr:replication factor C small subunit [Candidatus Aenigmarchaeota archaeon]
MEEIWTEKYRPQRLKEIIGQQHIIERLKHFIAKRSLPHMLFAGPAGVGKTTVALAIATELYGDQWHGNFLELNASDERGIDTIRVKVKEFARTIPMNGLFKVVYLDEADSLTKDAQHALRRTMENYAHICRFILACNYSGKIIAPIQSRCAVFRFSSLNEKDVTGCLAAIAKKEKLSVDGNALKAIFTTAEGDLRKAINILQMASSEKKITENVVYDVTSRADPEEVRKMIELSLNGSFKSAREMLLDLMYQKGLSGEDIIKEMHSQVMNLSVVDTQKMQIIERIGEYEFRLTEGSNPQIQLEALLAQIALIGRR